MEPLAARAFVGLVAGLVCKLFVLTAMQGVTRIGRKVFRWPEDAAAWGGRAAPDDEADVVVRAQAALRNDAENHPYMLAASAAWVAFGAPGVIACTLFGIYLIARIVHAYLLIRPIQPLRTRVYSVGQLVMLGIVVDLVRRAIVAG